MGFFDMFTGRKAPPAGTPRQDAAELRAAFLALNRDTAPFTVREGGPEGADLVAEWRIVDAALVRDLRQGRPQEGRAGPPAARRRGGRGPRRRPRLHGRMARGRAPPRLLGRGLPGPEGRDELRHRLRLPRGGPPLRQGLRVPLQHPRAEGPPPGGRGRSTAGPGARSPSAASEPWPPPPPARRSRRAADPAVSAGSLFTDSLSKDSIAMTTPDRLPDAPRTAPLLAAFRAAVAPGRRAGVRSLRPPRRHRRSCDGPARRTSLRELAARTCDRDIGSAATSDVPPRDRPSGPIEKGRPRAWGRPSWTNQEGGPPGNPTRRRRARGHRPPRR